MSEINNDIAENDLYRKFIIIGNGFDLQCNLPTRYADFFDYRFGISCFTSIENEKNDLRKKLREAFAKEVLKKDLFSENMLSNLKEFFQNFYKLQLTSDEIKNGELNEFLNNVISKSFTKWDALFLLASSFIKEDSLTKWNDIESMMFSVLTYLLVRDKDENLFEKFSFEPTVITDEGTMNLNIENEFKRNVKNIFCVSDKETNNELDRKALSMLDELAKFENEFSKYIYCVESKNKEEYWDKSVQLFNKLINVSNDNTGSHKIYIDVLSFNYSLNEEIDGRSQSFENKLEEEFNKEYSNKSLIINSWTNIHGIAQAVRKNGLKEDTDKSGEKIIPISQPLPIFGIDGHDILNKDKEGNINLDDPRSIFTKSFRLIDNRVNDIRMNDFQKNVDEIIFYGHSLSNADYSYFETIFDQYNIFDNPVKLKFYYYFGQHLENRVEGKKNERKAIKKLVRLLTYYGTTLKGKHGENLVNKLMLNRRIDVLPNPV